MSKTQDWGITVILNNIRSSENVGSIFRTCDAAGVSKIILAGITPTPVDRFGRENKGLTKVSLDAEKFVAWEKFESLSDAVGSLKNSPSGSQLLRKSRLQDHSSALKVIAIEQSESSIDYRELKKILNHKSEILNLALVFGNEVVGISKEDLALCDLIAEIPMRGKKESLNVSVAAGIVLFELLK